MRAIEQLKTDYNNFVNQDNENGQNKRWHPDYIVVAGDIVNFNNTNYDEPYKSIEELRAVFGIERSHVILVPGNHDKLIPLSTKMRDLTKDTKAFKDFCAQTGKDYRARFQRNCLSRFGHYIDFCNKYYNLDDDKSCEYYAPQLLDQSIKCLSGVKVFNEDNLCFVNVNTEWTYVPKERFNNYLTKGKWTDYQRVYENCQLCAPLIKDVYYKIREKYPQYTVVTVMHRGFEDLTWEENNETDPLTVNAVGYLLDLSDIIMTGHDHTVKTAPPTLIQNRIQHFRLGSAGRKEPFSSEHIRTASIIRISPFDSRLEMMHMVYQKNAAGAYNWGFRYEDSVYPLYSKFDRNPPLPLSTASRTLIKAQSVAQEDINRAIYTYFNPDGSVKLHIIEANEMTLESRLDAIAVNARLPEMHYIVVFFVHHLHYTGLGKDLLADEMNIDDIIRSFRIKRLNLFVTNCLIIKKVTILAPVFFIK